MKKQNKINTYQSVTAYDHLYAVLTLFAAATVIAPYMYILTFFNFNYPAFVSFLLTVICVFTGYGLQWVFGTVTHIKRVADSSAYENAENFFKPHLAIITIIIAIFAGFMIRNAVNEYFLYRIKIGLEHSFDKYSIIPSAIMLLSVVSIITGIVIWFYPFGRVISIKSLLPLVSVFFINYMITLVYGGVSGTFVTFCLFIFIICAFFLLNQSNIIRTFLITKTVKITSSARIFNIALILMVILGFIAALFVAISFIVGISALVKMALFIILSSVFRGDETVPRETSEIVGSFNDSVFGGLIDPIDASGNISKLFFIIFIIIIIGVMLFFIINRRHETWAMLKKFIIKAYNSIIDFIMSIIDISRNVRETYIIPDYRDEETKMDESSVKEYNQLKVQKKNSFRDFIIRLNTMRNDNEKLQYAYATLVGFWENANYGIKSSDTPREIMVKILNKSSDSEVTDFTEVFEAVKYAEARVDSHHIGIALDSICKLLQRYFD
jgi:hypothetical protein